MRIRLPPPAPCAYCGHPHCPGRFGGRWACWHRRGLYPVEVTTVGSAKPEYLLAEITDKGMNCPYCGREETWNERRCDSDDCPSNEEKVIVDLLEQIDDARAFRSRKLAEYLSRRMAEPTDRERRAKPRLEKSDE